MIGERDNRLRRRGNLKESHVITLQKLRGVREDAIEERRGVDAVEHDERARPGGVPVGEGEGHGGAPIVADDSAKDVDVARV